MKGFIHRPGVHCGSPVLRDIFEFHGDEFREDMIFGLGSGLNFMYWSMKRAIPQIFVGGHCRDLVGNVARVHHGMRRKGGKSLPTIGACCLN